MKKLNDLVVRAERADRLCMLLHKVNPHDALAIDDYVRQLQERAEKAEERVAELQNDCANYSERLQYHITRQGAAEARKTYCIWNYDEYDGFWSCSCGEDWIFTDGGPEDNRVKFCQGCGNPIEIGWNEPDTNQARSEDK